MGAQATFEYLVKVRDQSSKNLAAIKGKMLAVTAAATAIAAGIAKAADAFLGFEGALNEFKAVSGATAGQMERVSALAKEMGSTTKFSATESAEALTFLGRAGLTVEETMTALPGMLNLAAAGNLDLASAADIATNVMSGMGLGVDNLEGVVDVLSKTAASSNTNIEQLGTAMSYVAPIANSAGLSIEDTAAAVGILSDAGIQGTKAGTGLRGVIGSLVSPSKAASNVLADLGVSTLDSAGKMLPLDDIVQQLAESGAGTTEIMQIFGREAGPSMSVLLEKGAEGLRGFSGELQNADGHAKDTADTMQEGLTGAVTRMYSAMDTLWVVVGEKVAPVLTILADTVATAASEVTKLIEGSYSLAEILRFLSGGMIRYGDATDEARLAVAKHETEMQKGMAAAAAFQAEQKRLREATDDVAASMKAAKRSADDLAKALKDLQDREAALASATPGKMAIFQNSVVNAMSNSKAAVRAVLSPEVMAEWEGNLADMGDGPKNILGPRFRAGFHEAVVEPIPPLMEEAGKDASNAFAENFFSDLASSFRSGGTFMGSLKASVMDGMGNLFKEGGALQFIGDKWGEAMEFLGGIPVVGPFLKAFGPALMKGIGALAGKVWGGIKRLFGGPDQAQLERRDIHTTFAEQAWGSLKDNERYSTEVATAISGGMSEEMARAKAAFQTAAEAAGAGWEAGTREYDKFHLAIKYGNKEHMAEATAMYEGWMQQAGLSTMQATDTMTQDFDSFVQGVTAKQAPEVAAAISKAFETAKADVMAFAESAISELRRFGDEVESTADRAVAAFSRIAAAGPSGGGELAVAGGGGGIDQRLLEAAIRRGMESAHVTAGLAPGTVDGIVRQVPRSLKRQGLR